MIKTLIFGTGDSANKLLNNLPEDREYLAAVDNDIDKHGGVFRDMQIVPPSKISHFDYEEIIIASYWEGTIKKQLIEELNVAPEKIVTPNKKFYKNNIDNLYPFQHAESLALAHQVIKTVCGGARQKQIPLHLDYGTLLGIMREDELILWDDDIDLAANVIHAEQIEQHLLEVIDDISNKVNWQLRKDVDVNGRTLYFYLSFTCKPQHTYKPFAISIAMKGIENGMAVKLNSFGAWSTPACHIETLDTHCWNDTDVYIPNDYDGYLQFTYGNWRSPKKDLSVGEAENWKPVSIEMIKKAQLKSHVIYPTSMDDSAIGELRQG